MPERPWRCSQCGTINEPVANSCRACGKWPSLFDLEDNAVEEDDFEPLATTVEPTETHMHEAPEPVTVEVEPYEPEPVERQRRRFEPPPTKPVLEDGEAGGPKWLSWLVPLAFVIYIAIQFIVSAR